MRRAARVDGNQSAIVKALRQCGATVQDLSRVGEGCPDLAVGLRGKTWLMECKDDSKPPSARVLTDDQVIWHREWRGHVVVVKNVAEALAVIGATGR